jgi:hypothetical protein
MAVSLFALLRRLRGVISRKSASRPAAPAPAPRPVQRRPVSIQSLEDRRMFNGAGDVLVVTEQLIGPETAGVVVTLNQHRDCRGRGQAGRLRRRSKRRKDQCTSGEIHSGNPGT